MNDLIFYQLVMHLVRAEISLAPLNEKKLSKDQSGDKNENHLSMHRLMAAMFLMHTSVLHSAALHTSALRAAKTKLDTLGYHMVKTRSLYLTWP